MKYLRLEYQEDAIAVIHLDDASDKVNKLSGEMLQELDQALSEVESSEWLRGLIFISDKRDNFVAGADLKEMGKVLKPGPAREMIHRAHSIFDRIEHLSFPVAAAIHGHCLGGGMELALACHYRIATDHPKTQLGLPEVKLGLIPAGGGCQRLTRLIGARLALPLMLEGRTLSAHRAKALGLVDLKVYPHRLLEIARQAIDHLQENPLERKAYPRLPSLDWLLRYCKPARNLFFSLANRKVIVQTRGNYPAPELLLDCVETGISQGMEKGLEAEAEAFDQLVTSAQSRSLRQLFFATTALKKNRFAESAKPIITVGILGAGLMGSGIASVSAVQGLQVVLKDTSWPNLARGMRWVHTEFERRAQRQHWAPVKRDQADSRVFPTLDYGRFSNVDLVIEAVFEDLDLKHRVLQEVERHTHPECIIASNTSAIPIARISSVSRRPELVVGMHYFSPVPRMPLLEVVITPATPDWVRATVVSVGQRQGKTVIVVQDGPGFYTSRILSPYIQEALILLHEGARIDHVDEVMRQFGFPVGPFKLLDEVGIEVAAHVANELEELFKDRGFLHDNRLQLLIRDNYRGRKNGRGFYLYPAGWMRRLRAVPGVEKKPVNKGIYRYFGGPKRKQIDVSEIKQRLTLLMLNEAAFCFQEGIIESARDGDVGAVLGLGFPPFLGGPFRYLDNVGIVRIVEDLEKWAKEKGPRFKPAAVLVEMAKTGSLFYQDATA